jgi:hypothetical protein
VQAGYLGRFKAQRRLAIAFNGFSVAVTRAVMTIIQIRGLVGSRGISGVMVGWIGLMEMVGVVMGCMVVTFWFVFDNPKVLGVSATKNPDHI